MPLSLFATPQGGPIAHAGVPTDGNGRTCQVCHNSFPLNSPGGRVVIEAYHYRPGQTQTIKVTVSHPEAIKWGFQLTAREAKNAAARAGTFTLGGVRVRCSDVLNGRDVSAVQPCPENANEFAGHNENIVFGGANGAKTFEVQWTAPVNDVGNILFYAVGNAANNTTGNQGDRIYSDRLEIENEAKGCPNNTRPIVQGVRNAASGATDRLSMNTLVSVFGRDFAVSGTQREAGRADLRSGYPKELACAAVEINGERVPLTYVGPTQLNAQIPTVASTGTLQLRVISKSGQAEMASEPFTVNVQNYSPAFFTFNSNGKNVAAVHQDGTFATDPAVLPGAAAGTVRLVRGGDIISLYATGLGPTNPVWQAGEIPDRTAAIRERLTVTIGGTALAPEDVLYAGLVPGYISGLYQINLRVPATVAGGEVPIMLGIGGVNSTAGTVINVQNR
jgi:uncharacterized protein (TIGR03437 family)